MKKLIPAKSVSLSAKKARAGWLFVLPFIIGLVFFYIGIIVESISYSFAEHNIIPAARGGGYSLKWVGLSNYKNALVAKVSNDSEVIFLEKMFTGFAKQIIEVIAIILLSLFVAILLNQKMVGRAAFRAIFFVPVIVGAGIIAKIDALKLSQEVSEIISETRSIHMGGVGGGAIGSLVDSMDISALFQNLGIGQSLVGKVSDLVKNIYQLVNRSGVQMLIFLAGLQSISPSIYESCQMEGASSWEIFWKITLPMLSPIILANSVYTVIDSFTSQSNSVMTYILGMTSSSTIVSGTQAASAWLYFSLVIITLLLVALIASKVVFYQRRND